MGYVYHVERHTKDLGSPYPIGEVLCTAPKHVGALNYMPSPSTNSNTTDLKNRPRQRVRKAFGFLRCGKNRISFQCLATPSKRHQMPSEVITPAIQLPFRVAAYLKALHALMIHVQLYYLYSWTTAVISDGPACTTLAGTITIP